MKNICDVLIIGAGMSGLYAAYSATLSQPDSKVTLLTASELGAGGCSKRTHGINAAMNENDSCELHVKDTLAGGAGINNPKLVKTLCNDIINRINELVSFGVRFDKNSDGSFNVGTYGGSSLSRSVHWYDITGLEIVQELIKRIILNNCHVKENRWAINLLTHDKNCYGAIALNKETNQIETYKAKTVILATGGGACVYPIASISTDKLASGIIMGYKAGASLTDMEMVQFHPTGVLIPGSIFNGSLLEEEMRTQGGKLLNINGKRYMFDYDERGELATRDIVARSSYFEIMEGRGTKNNGIIFDISMIDKKTLRKRFPKTLKRLRSCDVDLLIKEKVEISPTAHFLMGGIVIDSSCKTEINNLYACGEDSGGIHGANRLGGNGVADALVFGYIAGESAARSAVNNNYSENLDPIDIEFYKLNNIKDYKNIDSDIKKIMWKNVGLIRNGEQLNSALEDIYQIKDTLQHSISTISSKENYYSDELILGSDLLNKIQLSIIITKSAIKRKNSIGAHYRSDAISEKTCYNTITKLKDNLDCEVILNEIQ